MVNADELPDLPYLEHPSPAVNIVLWLRALVMFCRATGNPYTGTNAMVIADALSFDFNASNPESFRMVCDTSASLVVTSTPPQQAKPSWMVYALTRFMWLCAYGEGIRARDKTPDTVYGRVMRGQYNRLLDQIISVLKAPLSQDGQWSNISPTKTFMERRLAGSDIPYRAMMQFALDTFRNAMTSIENILSPISVYPYLTRRAQEIYEVYAGLERELTLLLEGGITIESLLVSEVNATRVASASTQTEFLDPTIAVSRLRNAVSRTEATTRWLLALSADPAPLGQFLTRIGTVTNYIGGEWAEGGTPERLEQRYTMLHSEEWAGSALAIGDLWGIAWVRPDWTWQRFREARNATVRKDLAPTP